MIDFYYWPTPNGWKISIMLEECGLEYRTVPVNIGKGDQFKPEFLAISPNNRMPAIVDHDAPTDGPVSVFESGRDPAPSRRAQRPVHAGRAGRPARRSWNGCSGRSAISARWPGNSAISSTTRRASTPIRTSAMPTNTTAASACWSAGWTGRSSLSTSIRSPTWQLALGIDREAARPAARRIPQRRALARDGQPASRGTARRRSRQGMAPLGPALRRGTPDPVQPDRARRVETRVRFVSCVTGFCIHINS